LLVVQIMVTQLNIFIHRQLFNVTTLLGITFSGIILFQRGFKGGFFV
jgi:hypothetical protein